MRRTFTRLISGLVGLFLGICGIQPSAAQPSDFIDQVYYGGWTNAVGMTFDQSSTMYVWEKRGMVWIVKDSVKRPTPLIDISDEVGDWRDFGLLGFALDPYYSTNGYIYLCYVVDRHHLLNAGTPAYNPAANEYFNATIGRLTRYQVLNPDDPLNATVDPTSRTILIGATPQDGIPILHQSHAGLNIVFGTDNTLLITTGDGASYSGVDAGGSVGGSYAAQGIIDGIIPASQDVGAFRCQMLSSYSGKVLRIDRFTGEGIPSNPYFDSQNPSSVRSKVWALGLRNPFRAAFRPGTGSHNPADADPGAYYIGDVGWSAWEDLHVCDEPGQNFGWPVFEGMGYRSNYVSADPGNPDAPTPLGCPQQYYKFSELVQDYSGTIPDFPDPCNPGSNINGAVYDLTLHSKPDVDWKHGSIQARASVDGIVYNIGTNFPGNPFNGNCSVGGVWYTGDDFPEAYKNTYFHGDYGGQWIRGFVFTPDNKVDSVFEWKNGVGSIVAMGTDPIKGGLYYIRYGSTIHKFRYSPSGNQPPVAVAELDTFYAPNNTLTVQFDGSQSSDPEGASLSYQWDFDDGSPFDNTVSPSHIFTAPAGVPTMYNVILTVTDTGGLVNETQLVVSLNNTPPVIDSTTVDDMDFYPMDASMVVPLQAWVTDAEHALSEINFGWQTILFHDNHNHPEPIDNNQVTQTLITPVGCDGILYFYRIELTVTDQAGLSTTFQKDIYPNCDLPISYDDVAEYPEGGSISIEVLDNDFIYDGADTSTLEVVTPPVNGTASVILAAGSIEYTHSGNSATVDSFSYRFRDSDNDLANTSWVRLSQLPPPEITITHPLANDTIYGSDFNIFYDLGGYTAEVDYVRFELDGEIINDPTLDGKQWIDSLDAGTHSMSATLYGIDGLPMNNPEASVSMQFTNLCEAPIGSIVHEVFNNISGTTIADLTADPDFPDNPSVSDELFSFQGPSGLGNNYGSRVRGFLHPPVTGTYVFNVTGDDDVDLILSTDENPSNGVVIAEINGWTGPTDHTKYSTQTSSPIVLNGGQKYYVELLHKEGGGGDHFAVFWSSAQAGFSQWTLIDGQYISPQVICTGNKVPNTFPVEWLGLEAKPKGSAIDIKWATASELNNAYFTVERSANGESFEEVTNVASKGNSSSIQSYQVTDTRPFTGRSFYRIKQTDFDGEVSYSDQVEVFLGTKGVSIFPSPVRVGEELQVSLEFGQAEAVQLLVFDAKGQVVHQQQFSMNGPNQIVKFSTQDLPAGFYSLAIKTGSQRLVEKFSVSH